MNVLEVISGVLRERPIRDVFKEVARKRTVSFKEIAPGPEKEQERSELKRILTTLREAKLLAEEKSPLEDWTRYYVTADGLEVERALSRL